jgi:hypothetical protein
LVERREYNTNYKNNKVGGGERETEITYKDRNIITGTMAKYVQKRLLGKREREREREEVKLRFIFSTLHT